MTGDEANKPRTVVNCPPERSLLASAPFMASEARLPQMKSCLQAIHKATLHALILFFRVTEQNFNFVSSVLQNTSFKTRGSSNHQGAVILLTNVPHVMEILRESGTRMLVASEIWDSFEIDCYTGYFPLP